VPPPLDRTQTVGYDLGSKGVGGYQVPQRRLQSGFVPHQLLIGAKLSAVYAYSASLHQWISYDVPLTRRPTTTRHLGGMMRWEIGEDLPVASPQSLLGSAQRALFGTDR
jgi:hypothetical protein